jgi:hypothetical protein
MVPLQTTFQVDRAFGNAGSLDSLWQLDGESCIGYFVVIWCVKPNGLEALMKMLKGWKTNAPLAFS